MASTTSARGSSVAWLSKLDCNKAEIFDYIEGFYIRVRRHKHLDQLSPQNFEMQRQTAL